MVGEVVDRVLAVQQRPQDPQTRGISEQLQHVGRSVELRVGRAIYLRTHVDSVSGAALSGGPGRDWVSNPSRWIGREIADFSRTAPRGAMPHHARPLTLTR